MNSNDWVILFRKIFVELVERFEPNVQKNLDTGIALPITGIIVQLT